MISSKRLFGPAASLGLSACLVLAVVAAACGDDSPTGGSPATGGNPPEGGAGAGTTNGGAPTSGGGGADGGNGGAPIGGGGADCGLPLLAEAPELLSETGLYSDFADEILADDVMAYEPRYPLYYDGATKNRWAYLPPVECAGPIDTSDMDFWQVPVGTRFWKEFTRGGVRVETRLITRVGPGNGMGDFIYAAYHWDGSGDAVKVDDGVLNANNTGHNIPEHDTCAGCHLAPARILGFSAIQLTGNPGPPNMQTLSLAGALSNGLEGGVTIPGTDIERDALGCLHGNCGNCHFEGGIGATTMHLRVLSTDATVETTDTFLTAVNKPSMGNCGITPCDLIEPQSASTSRTWDRMGIPDMPKFGGDLVNTDCRDKLEAWINQLPLDANIP